MLFGGIDRFFCGRNFIGNQDTKLNVLDQQRRHPIAYNSVINGMSVPSPHVVSKSTYQHVSQCL